MSTPQPTADAEVEERPSMRPGGATSLVGTTLGGRYRIEKLLGEGGMGAVYQAEHTHMRKRLAVKVLHPEMSRLPEVVARFEREAMAAAHIDHPNVATATDFGKLDDGSFFLVLEFVEGRSLREALANGRLDVGRALRILRQVAAALQRAHVIGIVHRDLKPENVMLIDRDGEPDFVKVLDFGIAKVPVGELSSGAHTPGGPALTQLGMVYGTPEYMAPEQALGQNVDPRADIYALGVMAFELLAGVRPFDHESKVTLLGMHVTAPIPTIASKCPDAVVPPVVEGLVVRMLAKEAGQRFADAKELMDGIDLLWLPSYGSLPGAPMSQVNPRASMASLGSAPTSMPGVPSSVNILAAGPSVSGGVPAYPTNGMAAAVARAREAAGKLPRPALFAGAGVVGLFALLLVGLVVSRATRSTSATTDGGVLGPSSAGVITELPADDTEGQIAAANELIEKKGDYGTGIERLVQIEAAHGDRADVHRALERAYIAAHRYPEAMREAELWLASDEGAVRDAKLQEDVRNGAIGALGREAVEPAFALLETKMGTTGPDIIYDIAYGASGTGYPQAAARAQRTLLKPAVRDASGPTVTVTMDIRLARDCESKKRHFDKAREVGDSRTVTALKAYGSTRGCGVMSSRDCWPCMHRDGSLARTISAIEERSKAAP